MNIEIEPGEPGSAGFISWKRLAEEMFVGSKELRPDEEIVCFRINEQGINYFVRRKKA